jgi:hypothetical protein
VLEWGADAAFFLSFLLAEAMTAIRRVLVQPMLPAVLLLQLVCMNFFVLRAQAGHVLEAYRLARFDKGTFPSHRVLKAAAAACH